MIFFVFGVYDIMEIWMLLVVCSEKCFCEVFVNDKSIGLGIVWRWESLFCIYCLGMSFWRLFWCFSWFVCGFEFMGIDL